MQKQRLMFAFVCPGIMATDVNLLSKLQQSDLSTHVTEIRVLTRDIVYQI